MKLNQIFMSVPAAIFTCFALPASALDLAGTPFVVSNLFQGDSTDQVEVDVSAFGLKNNLFAKVAEGVELPGFIKLYDVDVSGAHVTFSWIDTDFSHEVGGPMPSDKHDRNYFTFDLPAGVAIKSVEFDPKASVLLEGSALPTVTLLAPNRFVTEFADGVVRSEGFRPSFEITLTSE